MVHMNVTLPQLAVEFLKVEPTNQARETMNFYCLVPVKWVPLVVSRLANPLLALDDIETLQIIVLARKRNRVSFGLSVCQDIFVGFL